MRLFFQSKKFNHNKTFSVSLHPMESLHTSITYYVPFVVVVAGVSCVPPVQIAAGRVPVLRLPPLVPAAGHRCKNTVIGN